MKYILDTSVIFVTIQKTLDSHVQNWFGPITADQLFISVLSLGEISRGVEKLTDHSRQYVIMTWLENNLFRWFGNQSVNVSLEVADKWWHLTASTPCLLLTLCLQQLS